MKQQRKSLPLPVVLALYLCAACGLEHPKPKGVAAQGSPFLDARELAGFYGYASISTIYSLKSRNQLPATVPGRRSPSWDPCDAARFLYGVREGR